jgi:hypothetical protein
MTLESARNDLLARGLKDLLQLYEVIYVVAEHTGIERHDDAKIMQPTLTVVQDLLEGKLATAGDAVESAGLLTVRSWNLSPAETIDKIREKWLALEEPPNLGDVVWLRLTDEGRARAEALG